MKIKRCPYCGKKPTFQVYKEYGKYVYFLKCDTEECNHFIIWENLKSHKIKKAIKKWNHLKNHIYA